MVYYLCRNMHLEHPHFIEVPSSPEGLYLRGQIADGSGASVLQGDDGSSDFALVPCVDVINRLNALRGKGMAAMYSWSCKR